MKLLERFFELFDRAFQLFSIAVLITAAGFGAYAMWALFGELDVGLLTRIGAALGGAVVSAVIVWITWLLMRAFN